MKITAELRIYMYIEFEFNYNLTVKFTSNLFTSVQNKFKIQKFQNKFTEISNSVDSNCNIRNLQYIGI